MGCSPHLRIFQNVCRPDGAPASSGPSCFSPGVVIFYGARRWCKNLGTSEGELNAQVVA